MRNILITRDYNRCSKLGQLLESQGFNCFYQPLFKVEKKSHSVISNNQNHIAIITSLNACQTLLDINFDLKNTIFAIGNQTAQELQRLGFKNIIISPQNSASSLKETIIKANLDKTQNILYLHGPRITLDFGQELSKLGFKVQNILAYDLKELNNFNSDILQFCNNKKLDFILIFSQNSAKIFKKLAIKHNMLEYFIDLKILCFSTKILKEVENLGFKNCASFSQLPILQKFYDQNFK